MVQDLTIGQGTPPVSGVSSTMVAMSCRWRAAIAAVLMAGAILPELIGSAQRAASAPPYPLTDALREQIVSALDRQYGAEVPSADFGALATSLEKEFERSPSLFTLLDYGLMLEAMKNARDGKIRKVPPETWRDSTFTRLREQLGRYVASRPVPPDTLPRRVWWVDAADRPAQFVNSRRKPVALEAASPSLFRSDVDVFAFGGVPFLTRERSRLAASGAAPGPFLYTTRFEPQLKFPTIAPLLGKLAPFVEMVKVQGAGTAEIIFDKPRETQFVTEEWSAIVDTGSGTFVGNGGRWPVYAITSNGVVRGRLTKVVSHGTQCSDRPGSDYYAQFDFDRPLPTATYAIVQTGAPFDLSNARITTARELTWFARPTYDYGLWYADLNADGHQDIAVAVGGVAKIYGDIFMAFLYANVNGRWKLLFVPDVRSCT
jgi:hypothetical protein